MEFIAGELTVLSVIIEEERENGDGDSGEENKELLLEERPQQNILKRNSFGGFERERSERERKKPKDKKSKIPVRQVKLPKVYKISDNESKKSDISKSADSITNQIDSEKIIQDTNILLEEFLQLGDDNKGVCECECESNNNNNALLNDFGGKTALGAYDVTSVTCEKFDKKQTSNGDSQLLTPESDIESEIEICNSSRINFPAGNGSLVDDKIEPFPFKGRECDKNAVNITSDSDNENDIGATNFYSLSPSNSLNVFNQDGTLLEAPEEFRYDQSQVEVVTNITAETPEEGRKDSHYRDHDNADAAETGDSYDRTKSDSEQQRERHGNSEEELNISNRDIKEQHASKGVSVDIKWMEWMEWSQFTSQGGSNNSGNIKSVGVDETKNSTEGHVGITAPVVVDGDTSTNYVNNKTDTDRVRSVNEVEMIECNDVSGLNFREQLLSRIIEDANSEPSFTFPDLENCNDNNKRDSSESNSFNECAEGCDALVPERTVRSTVTDAADVSSTSRFLLVSPSLETQPSIDIDGVQVRCAQALGCSRKSAVKVCVAPDDPDDQERAESSSCTYLVPGDQSYPENDEVENYSSTKFESINFNTTPNSIDLIDNNSPSNLCWSFKNGRLVFSVDESENKKVGRNNSEISKEDNNKNLRKNLSDVFGNNFCEILSSNELNKKDEFNSGVKCIEDKLKQVEVTDYREQIGVLHDNANDALSHSKNASLNNTANTGSLNKWNYDANQNIVNEELNTLNFEELEEEQIDFDESFSQFDVRQLEHFTGFNNGFCEVYDELDSSDEDEDFIIYRKEKIAMGTDSDRPKHNPDVDNLKSLLKRPGKNNSGAGKNTSSAGKDRKNRVVFNEKKNEFFDADYIILIREECDYDEEDDDGVCTCNQHEMVRLTCCEPNCNCGAYEGFEQTPQSPKFAPPMEFVDAVTLSPPEGYKDMDLGEQQLLALQEMVRRGQQRGAVCRECSASHDDEGDFSHSDEDEERCSDNEDTEEKEKTDQSQQTTPTSPTNETDGLKDRNYLLNGIAMTTAASEKPAVNRESEDEVDFANSCTNSCQSTSASPISGILKGGKLWKQFSLDTGNTIATTAINGSKLVPESQATDSSITSDEEGGSKRSVRFIESKRDKCDGAPSITIEENTIKSDNSPNETLKESNDISNSTSPESTEMMLTFKLGNHVLISNNSLKPNSAVRQLFPCTKPLTGKDDDSIHQYLVTAESLRAFEEAKRSKLPQVIQSGETDVSIKKAIERNTLRRSLIRYEPRSKKNAQKTDNSLVERIKQLTCNVDDVPDAEEVRASPPGEEARCSPEMSTLKAVVMEDKSCSPSSSSTGSSNSSSMSSTYKKLTDLFSKKEKNDVVQNNIINTQQTDSKAVTNPMPDLGNGPHALDHVHLPSVNEARKQFLSSTLAPLTACVGVSGLAAMNSDDYYYHMHNHHVGGCDRTSVASSVGTGEYSLEDIDDALKVNGGGSGGDDEETTRKIAPDVLAGTPSASESGDELAMFVQQDAGRTERIKKKYQPEPIKDEDDEHDDYGFNKRPTVRGIKPRFGSTNEIIQQIQNQLQPPPPPPCRVAWPYYSESAISTNVDNGKSKVNNHNVQYQQPAHFQNVLEETKSRGFVPQYRPTSLQDESLYQNSNQKCNSVNKPSYKVNGNSQTGGNSAYSTVMKVDGGCNEYYQSLPRRNDRPQSPPPMDMSKSYHQTMVYIPYNHIERCQPVMSQNPYYSQNEYSVSNHNQINKRYIEPIYHQRTHTVHVEEHHYNSNYAPIPPPKQMRMPYSVPPHLRSDSPNLGQFSTARATQTPVANMSQCSYYSNPRYRPVVGPVYPDPTYVSKMNRHSFPMGPKYNLAENGSIIMDSNDHVQIPNGFRQSVEISFSNQKDSTNSPTKNRFTERGVPEGAPSVSPQDSTGSVSQSSSSTMTSPTGGNSQSNVPKPMFYAMNV